MKKIVESFSVQFFVATHSTTLLAAIGHCFQHDASITYLKRGTDKYNAVTFDKYHKELTSVLGGHALMGPLFAVPLLLVEGDDDYRVWSQIPRHHVYKFSALPCHGDEIFQFQKTLERILGAVLTESESTSGFAILDGDKKNKGRGSQSHIKYIHLACHECENLYLTDEVLNAIGTDWTSVKQQIKSKAKDFGMKSERLASVDNWDRMTVDLKGIISEIAEIIDSKKVHWTLRVAQVIGSGELGTQLREFLGAEVTGTILAVKP